MTHHDLDRSLRLPPTSEPLDFPIASSSTSSLKRRASSSFDCSEDTSRKRLKEVKSDIASSMSIINPVQDQGFIDDLTQELQCGCCAELVYRPVLVLPCQHFFCGSCCVLWVKNGGSNCPACRGISTVAVPFRALQPMIDTLIRAAPHKARTERERQQADEIYSAGHSMRIPPPREISPPPDVNRSTEYVYPCPHCAAGNPFGWQCPQPVIDPIAEPARAWHVDDGLPPNHAHCGNCEHLLAVKAPQTTQCDLCLTAFCGIHVEDRCLALPLLEQTPHLMTTHADLIQSSDVYDCFDGNTVEVDIMLEYLGAQGLTPRHIYRQIIEQIQIQPLGFAPLIDLDLFAEVHNVSPVQDDQPRNRRNICRLCAFEVFLWGLKEWWVKERQKGVLDEAITNRKDCPSGSSCVLQKDDLAHAKEFNHIFAPLTTSEPNDNAPVEQALPPPTVVEAPPSQAGPLATPSTAQDAGIEPPLPTIPSVSSGSLSFLLNVDNDTDMGSSPPRALEMDSSTTDFREALEPVA